MKTEGKIWIIFDAVKNKKTKPLSVLQAQVMILGFKSQDMLNYHLWTPGWSEWLPLAEYLATNQKYFVQAQPPEPALKPKQTNKLLNSVTSSLKKDISEKTHGSSLRYTEIAAPEPPERIDYGYYYNEFTGDDLSLSGLPERASVEIILSQKNLSSLSDRRHSPRHELKIEAILLTKKGTSFRTYSRNISLTGTLLEDEIPKDFFNRPFELILINKFEKDARKNRVHLTGKIIGDLSDPKRLTFLGLHEDAAIKLKKLIDDYDGVHKKVHKNGA